MDREWFCVECELPPIDGLYEVGNIIDPSCDGESKPFWPTGVAYYDGYGFLHGEHYIRPTHWSVHVKLQKRYGKVQ